jgi:micrococcal nuclease
VPRRYLVVFVLIALAAGVAADVFGGHDRGGGSGSGGADDTPNATVAAKVVRVVDGDTIKIDADGANDTVRFIGMDTPESVKPGTPVQCYAEPASHRTAALLPDGTPVRLVVGSESRDRYGRLLAYVYRASDGLFVNAELLRGGYAHTLTIAPNDRLAPRFAQLQEQARAAGRGLWSACPALAASYG